MIYSTEIKSPRNGPEGYYALLFESVYMDHDFILLLAKKNFILLSFSSHFLSLLKFLWSICYQKSNYLKDLGFILDLRKTTANSCVV
jgi:hypothetical protein